MARQSFSAALAASAAAAAKQVFGGAGAGFDDGAMPEPVSGGRACDRRDVFADRLQRLSSTQRRVFLVLAMLGRPATVKLAAAAAHVSEDSCRDAFLALEQSGFVDVVDDGARAANDVASDIALDVAGSAGRAFLSGWIADALERDPRAQPAEL